MSPAVEQLYLLTVDELAELCQTGKDWIQKGCKARRWEFSMVAHQYRFTIEQARAIIAAHRVEAATVPSRDELAERRRGAA